MTEEKIKVLVVDDSAFMRKIVSDMLKNDPRIAVIGIARNGQEAIEKVRMLKPDLVTMDVEMPVMNGLDALKSIMATSPLPIVMLSSLTSEGADATIMALEAGAVDFIQKPSSVFAINIDSVKQELIEKILIAVSSNYKQKKGTLKENQPPTVITKKEVKPPKRILTSTMSTEKCPIVGIGTSTGGPRALQSLIPLIPGSVGASFLVVQHMPAGFTKSLAKRLDSLSEVLVKEAEDGEKILPSTVYIAPGNFHLGVRAGYNNDLFVELTQAPPVSGHRPSVDALFQSLAGIKGHPIIGVIMTGMGADGSKGLKDLKDKSNAFIIAQNEESCVVYGMPKNAVKLGIVDEVVPLEDIKTSILNRLEVL